MLQWRIQGKRQIQGLDCIHLESIDECLGRQIQISFTKWQNTWCGLQNKRQRVWREPGLLDSRRMRWRVHKVWFKPGLSQVLFAFNQGKQGKHLHFSVYINKTLQAVLKISTTLTKFCPLYQESSGFPCNCLATLGFCCLYTDAVNSSNWCCSWKASRASGQLLVQNQTSLSPWKKSKILFLLGEDYFRHKISAG